MFLGGASRAALYMVDAGLHRLPQDRDGGILLMSLMFGLFPFLLKLYADSGY